jgi:hypothetical protein
MKSSISYHSDIASTMESTPLPCITRGRVALAEWQEHEEAQCFEWIGSFRLNVFVPACKTTIRRGTLPELNVPRRSLAVPIRQQYEEQFGLPGRGGPQD